MGFVGFFSLFLGGFGRERGFLGVMSRCVTSLSSSYRYHCYISCCCVVCTAVVFSSRSVFFHFPSPFFPFPTSASSPRINHIPTLQPTFSNHPKPPTLTPTLNLSPNIHFHGLRAQYQTSAASPHRKALYPPISLSSHPSPTPLFLFPRSHKSARSPAPISISLLSIRHQQPLLQFLNPHALPER